MTEKIIIAGSGGQGIMLLGKILATAAMKEGKFVTWLPSYGAEVRGGTAHCMVIISDEEIGSPYVNRADAVIIMNEPSLKRFKDRITKNGLLIVNSSLARAERKANLVEKPFTDIALKLGNIRIANMVALGCFLAQKKIVSLKSVEEVIQEFAPVGKESLIEINKMALKEGIKLR